MTPSELPKLMVKTFQYHHKNEMGRQIFLNYSYDGQAKIWEDL